MGQLLPFALQLRSDYIGGNGHWTLAFQKVLDSISVFS